MTRAAIVLAGGDPVDAELKARLPEAFLVVAADSGLHQAGPLGLHVDCVVGDFDSADPAEVEAARAAGADVERHPPDKDATDLELALDAACARGAAQVTVVGGAGGRLDHFLGNVGVLASPRFAGVEVDAWFGDAYVRVLHGGGAACAITGAPGSLVTLLPAGGDAHGITTAGLEYPLRGETLPAGTTRGVSNVLVGSVGSVVLEQGTLLVVQAFGGAR